MLYQKNLILNGFQCEGDNVSCLITNKTLLYTWISKWVLRTALAGQNIVFSLFFTIFTMICKFLVYFGAKWGNWGEPHTPTHRLVHIQIHICMKLAKIAF